MKKILISVGLAAIAISGFGGDVSTNINLLASVSVNISTNVVTGDNSSGCNMCYDNYGNWKGFTPAVLNHVPCQPYHPPTESWTITNVVKRVTLTTEWSGKNLSYVEETILSSITNRLKLVSEWKSEK